MYGALKISVSYAHGTRADVACLHGVLYVGACDACQFKVLLLGRYLYLLSHESADIDHSYFGELFYAPADDLLAQLTHTDKLIGVCRFERPVALQGECDILYRNIRTVDLVDLRSVEVGRKILRHLAYLLVYLHQRDVYICIVSESEIYKSMIVGRFAVYALDITHRKQFSSYRSDGALLHLLC